MVYVDAGEDGCYYSVLLGVAADGSDEVLYKQKLPGNPILGEGKPENQYAIVFTRGEYLQTLDMNQDNYMGEAYKMRNPSRASSATSASSASASTSSRRSAASSPSLPRPTSLSSAPTCSAS